MSTLGIIAGLGDLPVSVAKAALSEGRDIFVIRLAGFEEPKLADYPGEVAGLGQLGKQINLLKAAGCEEIVFAGLVKRPNFKSLKLDFVGARLLPKVIAAARQGDDALLRVVSGAYEAAGFRMIGADDVSQSMLAGAGLLCGESPDDAAMSDLKKAASIANTMGLLDVGQGAIVCDGLVLCVEAQEGTDAMIERCAALEVNLRGSESHPRGVLVKRPKPMQERRIDLPTVGVATVERARRAGLVGIGLETGGALLVDRDAVFARAEALGLFIFGFPADWN